MNAEILSEILNAVVGIVFIIAIATVIIKKS